MCVVCGVCFVCVVCVVCGVCVVCVCVCVGCARAGIKQTLVPAPHRVESLPTGTSKTSDDLLSVGYRLRLPH